jgi:hypothetical protein
VEKPPHPCVCRSLHRGLDDPDAPKENWGAIKAPAADGTIKLDGAIGVSRPSEGKIHGDDDLHATAKGAGWGAVGAP